MKTSTFKTMMIIGMMTIGTVTTFGKTNTNVHHDRHHNTRTEVVVVKNHNSLLDRHMRPGMNRRFFIDHMMEGRHYIGRNHECTVCHLTKREIREVEKEMRHSNHTPACKTVSFRR